MRNLKQFGRNITLVGLMILTTLAQTPIPTTVAQNPAPPDVNILIQPRQVQFVAQKAIQELRFQVFDEHGDLVYDSGARTEPELKWDIHNGNGGELTSGLYRYTLTVKEQGKDTVEEKRGHFIVERAAERQSDRLWMTSQGASGVGTNVQGAELTVAASGQGTVAGVRQANTAKGKADDRPEPVNAKAAVIGFNNTRIGRSINNTYSVLSAFPFHELPVEISNINSSKCLAVSAAETASGSNVAQYQCTGDKNQTWFLIYTGGSNYQIRAGQVGNMNLDIAGGSLNDGGNVQIANTVTDSQIFGLVSQPDGNYEIVSKLSGKCLDVAGASTVNGANVQQFTCHGGNNQRWRIRPRAYPLNLIAKHSEKCMDVASASTANNANVQQYPCFKAENQRWYIQYAEVTSAGTPYYSLVSNGSGKCLDVAGASTANGANVQQFACNGGDNQKWAITENADGYVTIQNKLSGKCLDVAGASTSNNANVQQYTCHGGDNQRWWWANYAERHIQIVQVAKSDGSNRTLAVDANVQKYVARTNGVYQRYGIKLVYDPLTDKSDVNSDALYQLGSSSTFKCPDGSTGSTGDCAHRYATKWPNKVVIFTRPGGAFTSGDANYIAIGSLDAGSVCTDVPNTQWLAHEFGHYMGLNHTFVLFNSNADASAYLVSNGGNRAVFDGDRLGDTNPVPLLNGHDCIAPHSATATVTLQGSTGPVVFTVNTDNVLSYYYNANVKITPQQASITRATSFARGY